MARLAPAPELPTTSERSRPHWWREVLLLVGVYFIYDGVRLVVAAGHGEAFTNAHRVLGFERTLHFAQEQPINHVVSASPPLAVTMSFIYATLHYLVTPIVLVWMWKKHPGRYPGARTVLVIATLLGLIGFWLFPTAPPRMLPGFIDTLQQCHQWGWWGGDASAPQGLAGLTNEFAAMPSLHVGWAAWCGWHIASGTSRQWLRALGVAYPIFIFAVVIGTANHYIADTLGGLVVIVAAGGANRLGRALRTYASLF